MKLALNWKEVKNPFICNTTVSFSKLFLYFSMFKVLTYDYITATGQESVLPLNRTQKCGEISVLSNKEDIITNITNKNSAVFRL
jgi:hypothetical protein